MLEDQIIPADLTCAEAVAGNVSGSTHKMKLISTDVSNATLGLIASTLVQQTRGVRYRKIKSKRYAERVKTPMTTFD